MSNNTLFAILFIGVFVLMGFFAYNYRHKSVPAEVQTRALLMEMIDEIETMRKECEE